MTTALTVIRLGTCTTAEDYYKLATEFALGDLVYGRASFPHPQPEFYRQGKNIFNHVMDLAIATMHDDELIF